LVDLFLPDLTSVQFPSSAANGKILPRLTLFAVGPMSCLKIMASTVTIIGIEPEELPWMRLLMTLLRHPDPVVPELARQALLYLQNAAQNSSPRPDLPMDHAG
jgi:hypothetical protein